MSKIVGHNERWLPSPPFGDRKNCYLVVLVQGDVGDYTAYSGIVYKIGGAGISAFDKEFVAAYGDKISEAEARCHFPTLPKDIRYND